MLYCNIALDSMLILFYNPGRMRGTQTVKKVKLVSLPSQFLLTPEKNLTYNGPFLRLCEAAKPSKGQRSRRNRAARAAAGGSSTPFQPARLGPGAHSLPPKPGKPPQSQPYQAQHWRATQVIRRQQKTPSAFLKLPADILAQIILHLNPLDLIYLTQVNTSVRRVLMHRSAGPMWRACIENAGLPTCPLELSEPKYVSTLYLPICSACGGKGEQRLDTYLLVRLCLPCSEQMLVNWETIKPADLQAVVFASTESYRSHKERAEKLRYSLRREVNDARAQMNQLWDSRDAKALQTWVQTRKTELQMRKERGGHIVEFLQTAHRNKLDELRREWVKEAECRLLALGYTLMKEKDLPPQKRGAWRELFHRTDPFTETKWNKLKQRVIDFLKAETNERAQRERKQRLSNRDSALRELFKSL
ncbi:hypothetical protein FRC12_013478 [Ceratobasidium sp. 428]|nr:hypothetical protein FRC12_013478 [Ceratobasidium sp. 428]